jgi:WD40 repeat protein
MEGRHTYKYDAFISYRHCEPDKSVAEKLHRMLEGFRVPKSIAKVCGKKVIKRVFRDREELPTSANLADNITEALRDSEYLIVVCSPRTPQSQWVLKEIEDFKAMHGHDKILALLVEGEPGESFPKQLCYVKKQAFGDGSQAEILVEVEPLAADIRASSEREMFKKLRTEILRLLSPMLNCGFDDLKQRHRERRIKAILTASLSISAFFIAFGAVSMYQSMVISRQNQEISKKNEEIVAQIQKTQISQSRYLADISAGLLEEGDRYRAVLAACEALPKDLTDPERPYVEEAEYALSKALGVYEIDNFHDMDMVLDHNKPVDHMDLSTGGKTLLTVSRDGWSRMWNIEDGKCTGEYFTDHSSIFVENSIAFIGSDAIVYANYDNITCFDTKGELRWQRESGASQIAVFEDRRVAALLVGKLKILDASNGDTITEIVLDEYMDLESTNNYVSCIRFSADGTIIGVGTSFGTICLFDAGTGSMLSSFSTGLQYVEDIAFSPDGYIAAASNHFDTEDLLGKGRGMLDIYLPGDDRPVITIEFSHSAADDLKFYPYDSDLVILTEGEKLNVCDIKSGQVVYSFLSGDRISDYEMFDGFIVTSSFDGTIRFCFMSGSGFESEWHRIIRPEPITGIGIGGGRIAMTCQSSKKVYIMSILSNENTVKLAEHNDTIEKAVFSPDGRMSLSAGIDGELVLCSIPDRKAVKSISLGGRLRDCRFVSNDRIIAVLEDGGVLLLDDDLQIIREETMDYISWVGFSNDNTFFAVGCGRQVTVFSSDSLDTVASAESGYSAEYSFTDDNRLMLVDRIGEVKLLDPDAGTETILNDDEGIITGAVSGDGSRYTLAFSDKTIKLYDTSERNKEPVVLKNQVNGTERLLFSPDSKLLFAGYDDYSIEVFDSHDGTLLASFSSDYLGSPLERVIFSQDGSRIACIDETRNTVIIDSSTYKVLAEATISDIDRNFEKILTNWNSDLFLLPVYTPQMLLDEAQKQLNGRTLTDREKIEMFIE